MSDNLATTPVIGEQKVVQTLRENLDMWLIHNKIRHRFIDDDIVDIEGFGKLYINDLSGVNSIFRKVKKTGEIVFNLMCDQDSLISDGIEKVTFLFGKNWYWFDLNKGFDLKILKYVGEREGLRNKELDSVRFVNLGIHTPYELLNGSFKFSEWIAKAKHLGQDCMR